MDRKLYELMTRKGYPSEFADLVAQQMHTPYTEERMIAYVSRAGMAPPQEFADEMLAIMSDRDRWVRKKEAEYANQKYNEYLNRRREED